MKKKILFLRKNVTFTMHGKIDKNGVCEYGCESIWYRSISIFGVTEKHRNVTNEYVVV